jgi:hypothetical protein
MLGKKERKKNHSIDQVYMCIDRCFAYIILRRKNTYFTYRLH